MYFALLRVSQSVLWFLAYSAECIFFYNLLIFIIANRKLWRKIKWLVNEEFSRTSYSLLSCSFKWLVGARFMKFLTSMQSQPSSNISFPKDWTLSTYFSSIPVASNKNRLKPLQEYYTEKCSEYSSKAEVGVGVNTFSDSRHIQLWTITSARNVTETFWSKPVDVRQHFISLRNKTLLSYVTSGTSQHHNHYCHRHCFCLLVVQPPRRR